MHDSRLSVGLHQQISAFLAGDRAAGEVLARRASRLALRTALAVLRDREDAGDVAQEVVVEALRSLGALRDPGAFDAWVHRITVRVTSRALAKRARRTATQLSLDDAPKVGTRTRTPISTTSFRREPAWWPRSRGCRFVSVSR